MQKPNDQNPEEIAVNDIPITNPEGIKSVYCNNIQIAVTPWDLRLLCAEIQTQADGTLAQIVRANVVMSIRHAKALHDALSTTLNNVEKQEQEKSASASKK